MQCASVVVETFTAAFGLYRSIWQPEYANAVLVGSRWTGAQGNPANSQGWWVCSENRRSQRHLTEQTLYT
eukprot:3465563-Amphidinium_carterae.1